MTITIRFSTANAYLIPARNGYILIDTGDPGFTPRLFQTLARHAISPSQIKLIILTHTHFDHIGGLWAIQAQSHAPVLVHTAEAADLAAGRVTIPPGAVWPTRPLSWLGQKLSRFFHFPGYRAEYVVNGADMPLAEFGLEGRLLHTPGHSPGSLSIVLANGAAFVGDLCPNTWYNRWLLRSHFPPYADDIPGVYASWRKLLASPAHTLYPGHGPSYPAEALRREVIGDYGLHNI